MSFHKRRRCNYWKLHRYFPVSRIRSGYHVCAKNAKIQLSSIDINNKGNGTLVTYSVNSHLNNHNYMDAVLKALQDAKKSGATKEDVISILQDIGEQIEISGDYP